MANLVLLYGVTPGDALTPAMEDTDTIDPDEVSWRCERRCTLRFVSPLHCEFGGEVRVGTMPAMLQA